MGSARNVKAYRNLQDKWEQDFKVRYFILQLKREPELAQLRLYINRTLWPVIPGFDRVSDLQIFKKVFPFKIHLFDQVYLPLSVPFFQLFFSCNSIFNTSISFIIDQFVTIVFRSKSSYVNFVFVFRNTGK